MVLARVEFLCDASHWTPWSVVRQMSQQLACGRSAVTYSQDTKQATQQTRPREISVQGRTTRCAGAHDGLTWPLGGYGAQEGDAGVRTGIWSREQR
jgi:hypothetical protein